MSKKKIDLIPSYSIEELTEVGGTHHLLILVEDEEEVYKQVKLSTKVFNEVCKIINKGRIGFNIDVFKDKYTIQLLDEED